jgi:hypothetical protein
MFTTFIHIALFAALAIPSALADLTVNVNATQLVEVSITFLVDTLHGIYARMFSARM